MQNVQIIGRTAEGNTVFFTGRAGADFVSPDAAQAFAGFNLDGARRKATALNVGTALHGIRFVAVVPEEGR